MSEIRSLDSARKKRDLERNLPSQETVVEKLQLALEVAKGNEYVPKKVIVLMLDDTDDIYDIHAVTGGLKAQEASFLCNYASDIFKDFLRLPTDE